MKITIESEGPAATISPEGRIDTVTAPELEEAVSGLLRDTTSLVFDFAKVEYISSAGLRVLLMAHKAMKKSGGSMSVANIPPLVEEVFRITGFSDVFAIV